MQETRSRILKYLIQLTKEMKIKSFSYDEKVIDFRNVDDFNIEQFNKGSVLISNKFINLFLDEFSLEEIRINLLRDTTNFMTVIEYRGRKKVIIIEITNHAVIQFIKRFIYLMEMDSIKVEFNKVFNDIKQEHHDDLVSLFFNEPWDNINSDKCINEIFQILFSFSKPLSTDNMGRHRDIYEIKRRNEKYDDTVRYFSHPFLFIVQNNVLKTVELYSSSYDFRSGNYITSNNTRFTKWFKGRTK